MLSLPALFSLPAGALPLMERIWLERLAVVVPGPSATRWLLVADTVCLILIGLASQGPAIAVPLAIAAGFVVVNTFGMVVNDFYLGLALFHLAVGFTALVWLRRARWAGAALLILALSLGALT